VVSNIFYFHPENWGNDPIWLILSHGLVQPPTRNAQIWSILEMMLHACLTQHSIVLKTWTNKTTERSPLTRQRHQKSYELTNGLKCKRLFDIYPSHLDFFDESKFSRFINIPVYPWNHGTRPLPYDSDVMMTWPLKRYLSISRTSV